MSNGSLVAVADGHQCSRRLGRRILGHGRRNGNVPVARLSKWKFSRVLTAPTYEPSTPRAGQEGPAVGRFPHKSRLSPSGHARGPALDRRPLGAPAAPRPDRTERRVTKCRVTKCRGHAGARQTLGWRPTRRSTSGRAGSSAFRSRPVRRRYAAVVRSLTKSVSHRQFG
jgi:hypothetical protein